MVSIVLPAYNEEESIAVTLRSLLNLDYPKDKLEIIVVANNCTDKTVEIVKTFAKQGVKLIETPLPGKARAQNIGIKKARGEFIIIADADAEVKPDALQNVLKPFEDDAVALVVTSVIIKKPHENLLQKLQHYEYLLSSLMKRLMFTYNSLFIISGAFNIYRKSALLKVGKFDEDTLTEDAEMATRLLKNGFTVASDMNTKVVVQVPKTFRGFFVQRLRWSRGLLEIMMQKHRDVLLNPKYGFFGVVIAPIMMLWPVIGCVLLFYLIYRVILSVYMLAFLVNLKSLSLLIRAYTPHNVVFNLVALIPTIMIILSSLYFLTKAKLHLKEKLISLPALIIFVFVYPLILSLYWPIAMVLHYSHAKKVWRGNTRW